MRKMPNPPVPVAPACGSWPLEDAAPEGYCNGAEADLCFCAFARTSNSSCFAFSTSCSSSLVSASMPKVSAESSDAAADIAAVGGREDERFELSARLTNRSLRRDYG